MQQPLAFKILPGGEGGVFRVKLDPIVIVDREERPNNPAIVVTRSAKILKDLAVGVLDENEILSVQYGDWSRAVLIILGSDVTSESESSAQMAMNSISDQAFLSSLPETDPDLTELAKFTIGLIRKEGIPGVLVENKKGRWINSPVNIFTLKVQHLRARDINFTLYGNPYTYNMGDFLKKDQNSYSRGSIKNEADARKFVDLAKLAMVRRRK